MKKKLLKIGYIGRIDLNWRIKVQNNILCAALESPFWSFRPFYRLREYFEQNVLNTIALEILF